MAATHSDGVHARVKSPARIALASTQEEAERWFFDTHGYVSLCTTVPSACAVSRLRCLHV